ncbi:MAG TPA: hypothetical protein VMU03_08360, partial [Gammaproteobacteria bacterium]|nr:hypothetical protein [Gammaproteobacteria bacterium]
MSGHEQLVAAFLDLHATNAARLLEAMPVEQTNAVLASVDAATAAPVFAQMLPTYAAQCLELQPPAGGALLLERLGRPLYQLALPVHERHEILVSAAERIWR